MDNAYRRTTEHPDTGWTHPVHVTVARLYRDEVIMLGVGDPGNDKQAALTIETAKEVVESLQEAIMLAELAEAWYEG